MADIKLNIKDLSLDELRAACAELGEPAYRAGQIWRWLYSKGAESFDDITNLSKDLRQKLDVKFVLSGLELIDLQRSRDGTEKYLLRLSDGNDVESVLIPASRRLTQCISTQVGCKFACLFCASGKAGFIRDLTPGEIVDQVLFTTFRMNRKPSNIVLMGIGEPLDNYDNVEKAIRTMNSSEGLNIGARKVTISTCGIIPGIKRLEGIGLQIELSVSLHAVDDDLRTRLMPINKKYPVRELIDACRGYAQNTNRQVTFEYLMIEGLNDSLDQAEELAKLLQGFLSKVNLITMNTVSGSGLAGSDVEHVERFCSLLNQRSIPATIRKPRGTDILAACGQLRLSSAENQ